MKSVFCPEENCNSDTSSSEDWKWRRQHFILGVAVKDTCVTPVYRDASSTRKKRKKNELGGGSGSNRLAKLLKKEQSSISDAASAAPSTTTEERPSSDASATPSDNKPTNNETTKSNANAKKPAGYTFLTPSQSSQICAKINAHIARKGGNDTSNYMHTHLRIPQYISTMIVPTFSLDHPTNNAVEGGVAGADKNDEKDNNYAAMKQPPTEQKQQHHKQNVIPKSTKDSMPVDTPHGWQKTGPEQYWDAVLSLTISHPSTSPTFDSLCVGAVGLFDHMGQVSNGDASDASKPQARDATDGKWNKSLWRVVERTNEWSCRTQNCGGLSQDQIRKFWNPVHMAASHLPSESLSVCPWSFSKLAFFCSNVAIVGWDAFICSRDDRRQALRKLMATMQSSPPPVPPREYLVLSVSDLQSILDAAREGVSVIGTDLVRQWSRSGRALCLDLTLDSSDEKVNKVEGTIGGIMELKDEHHARDFLPILPGCKCITCRPRQKNTSKCNNSSSGDGQMELPSFTRAYIHHLIKAKEMLAETLLFVHNLHQMLLLFRQLSKAASLDGGTEEGTTDNLAAFVQRIEEQMLSAR